jgi:hypothetical protein
MNKRKIYFYIPGGESLNILYFLAGQYGCDLIVITSSIFVREVCGLMNIVCIYPKFNPTSVSRNTMTKDWLGRQKKLSNLIKVISGLCNLLSMVIVIYKAKKVVASMPNGCTLYYSTYYYDVPGIIFLGEAIRSTRVNVKLAWPSKVRFDKIKNPAMLSEAFFLNKLTENLFTYHLHPTNGRVIGVNPEYLRTKNIQFIDDEEVKECELPYIYKKKAFSLLGIKSHSKVRVLLLGEYSVEECISTYGEVYLKMLNMISEIDGVQVFYKPHPSYHILSHPSLKKISVLDTRIPVEFLDDGSWSYIVAFFTASLMTKKQSRCICLLKLRELGVVPFDFDESIKLMKKSSNNIIYPECLAEFEMLLNGQLAQ